ncbi:MAG TPA: hypothetical protein VGX23_29545 [Actinocrinis sp.]|nr:hypothetical protein [Actinocrinis sp.]
MTSAERGEPAERTFPGDREMARRMREHPWAESGMTDPAEWTASLRTATRICLTSRFPMIVWWGPGLHFLYNDAYLPLLGTNHPALGKPGEQVWSEIWHIIGPMLESVMADGQATWSEDLLLPLSRHGYLEETYWTYSALAALGLRLARAGSVPEAVQEALEELRALWSCSRVLAVAWGEGGQPELTSSPPGAGWADLPEQLRETLGSLRDRPLLSPVSVDGASGDGSIGGIAAQEIGGGTDGIGDPDGGSGSESSCRTAGWWST